MTLDKEKLFSGVRRSRLYQGSRIRRQIMDNQKDPIIRVINADSLDEALRLKRQGYKPIVLDMANREYPGGGTVFLPVFLPFILCFVFVFSG